MEYIDRAIEVALKHKKDLKFIAYIIVAISVLFAVNSEYLSVAFIPLYIGVILAVSLIIFFSKFMISRIYNIRLYGDIWVAGLVFSFVVSLVLSSFGMPVLIPILSLNRYGRLSTIKGIKKGEVNIHEKWKIVIFSAMAILAFSMLFLFAWKWSGNVAFFAGGIALAMFVLVDFLPLPRFEGSMLIYHNQLVYSITLAFLVIIGVLSLVSLVSALTAFIVFVAMNFAFYFAKLW